MKSSTTMAIVLAVVVVIAAVLLLDFRVTDEGALPNVEVTGGEMPEAELRGPDIDVTTETREVEVPTDINVETETETYEVPTDIDVELPEDRETEVEVEVTE